VIAREPRGDDTKARLAKAVETGETVEVIFALRGKLRRGSRPGCWRLSLEDGSNRTLTVDGVIAVTPIARRAR